MTAADNNKPTRTSNLHGDTLPHRPPPSHPLSLMWHVSVPKHTGPICVMITQTRGVRE